MNAEGSSVIIVVIKVGTVKIYVAAVVEALGIKTKRGDETQFTTRIGGEKAKVGSQLFRFVL
jgi:hypothetical protein